jgi:transposase-like protein
MELTAQKTLVDAIRFFSDEQNCIDTVAAMRWPDGKPTCPHCQSQKNYWLATQRRWKCAKCRKQFSVKVGTIFEDSALSLDKWLVAMWMLVNCKNGVSSYEIMRDLKVTQKSAWFMLQRLRLVLEDEGDGKLAAVVQIDESFFGGKVKNMHKSKRPKNVSLKGGNTKAIVLGMLERGGRVRARIIADRTRKSIEPVLKEHIEDGATIHTDEFSVYARLNNRYIHEVVNHAETYVKNHVHTNGIENFWSLLKRGLNGTYISVEPFHLFRYVGEQVFRYNNRATKDNPLTDVDRFGLALSQIAGKRLTYAQVTGKEGLRF